MRLILSILCFLSAGPALAQGAAATLPGNPMASSVAYAEADRIIAAGEAGAFFENITSDAQPTVIHRASGFVCRFEAGHPTNRIVIYSSELPGQNVGCSVSVGDVNITHYATRYPQPTSAEQEARNAIYSIQQSYRNIRPYEGDAVEFGSPDLPQVYVGRLVAEMQGVDLFTQVATADINGWIFKQRLSARPDEARAAQITGAAQWIGMLALAQARPFDTQDD